MDIQTYAAILLVARLISMTFIFLVLRRQWTLFKLPISANIRSFRRILFIFALIIFIGNIVPAMIDILTVFADLSRTVTKVRPVGYIYSMTAAGTALVSSYLIWKLYQLASDEKEITDFTETRLEKDLKAEKKKRR